jgi:predicted nucleic acid-binding protein
MRFVLDASVALSWLLRDTAPRGEAKELVTAAQSGSFISLLEAISLEVDADTFTQVFSDTLQLSRRYRLSFLRRILS